MKHPLIQLTIAHFKEYLREPGAMFWSFGFPVLMALGLGLAFSGKKEIVYGVGVIPSYKAGDTLVKTTLVNEVIPKDTLIKKRFESQYNKVSYYFYITTWDRANLLMKRGNISAIVEEKNNDMIMHCDPKNPEAELISIHLEGYFKNGEPGFYKGKLKEMDTQGTRYIDFLIPGLLGLGIMMSVMWGVCYSLIEKRSKKLLRRMVATPMRKSHFLLAQWGSRIMMMAFESAFLLVFSIYFFDIEIQGSVFLLILVLLAGNFCFFGLAILISSKTSNTQLGNGLISLITTPMMVLSGIFFSYQNFPGWIIKVIKTLPLTNLVDNIRSIVNEGAGIIHVLPGILLLVTLGLICFLLGLKLYKWY